MGGVCGLCRYTDKTQEALREELFDSTIYNLSKLSHMDMYNSIIKPRLQKLDAGTDEVTLYFNLESKDQTMVSVELRFKMQETGRVSLTATKQQVGEAFESIMAKIQLTPTGEDESWLANKLHEQLRASCDYRSLMAEYLLWRFLQRIYDPLLSENDKIQPKILVTPAEFAWAMLTIDEYNKMNVPANVGASAHPIQSSSVHMPLLALDLE